MTDKKLKPVIEILTGSLTSGNRSTIFGISTSPKTPSESKPQSPKFEIGAVGLSIVAALEKSGELPANKALFSRNLTRSILIPAKNCLRSSEEMEMERLEEYTIVTTRHGPNKSHTKVYGSDLRVRNSKNIPSVFHISPIGITETAAVSPSDFLSSCNLCHKKLHDKDIYMYRGEKAFCSTECRYRQIMMDERTEKRNLEASIRLPVEVTPSSPYANSQIYSNGILAI